MSKIGKISISIPEKVKVVLAGNMLNIEGPLGKKSIDIDLEMFNLDIKEGKEISIKPKQIIVPRKGVTELIRLLQTTKETTTIRISKNHIQAKTGHLAFTSKLIDGKFPDYQKVIPEPSEAIVVADREALKNSLERVSILSNEKYRGVRIAFASNTLSITAHNPEKEEADEELGVDYQGEEMEIGFNVLYLIEALKTIKTEKVKLSVQNPNSSCLITPEKDFQCQYVVMPMKL